MTPLVSQKRAQTLFTVLFLLCLAALIFTDAWWPGIMLAVGLPLALRQFLLGRTYDTGITLLVFLGTFITVQYDISWRIILPVLFSLGALYLLLKEFLESKTPPEDEREADLNRELEERKKK